MEKTSYFYRKFLKILLLVFLVTLTVGIAKAQQNAEDIERKQAFEKQMETFIVEHLNENIDKIK